MKRNLVCLGLVLAMILAGTSVVLAGGKSEAAPGAQPAKSAEAPKYYESKFFPALGKIPAPSKKYRIGCLVKTLINDFWMDFENGYKDANKVYDVVVDVYGAPSETDLLVQKQILDDMIAKNYDILLVSPLTDSNLLAALKTATDRGIPIINVCDAYISPDAQKKHGIKIGKMPGW
jgi:ABC-type sugar transport system substrate-binding protein